MINSMWSRVRDWSTGTQFLAAVAVFATVVGGVTQGLGYTLLCNVLPLTALALGLRMAMPPVSRAFSWYLRRRSGVPCRHCGGTGQLPSALDWHRAVWAVAGIFAVAVLAVLANFATLSYALEAAMVLTSVAMVSFLLTTVVVESLVYLVDRRVWRRLLVRRERERAELAAEQQAERMRARAERDKLVFWDMVSKNYPSPGA